MILVLICSLIIFVVLYATGLFSLNIYDRFFRIREIDNYSVFDVVLIGLSAILIPLQIWSLFLPSNQYFLAIMLVFSFAYFFYKRKYIVEKMREGVLYMKGFSWIQILIMFLFVLITLGANLWVQVAFDPEFYHYQAIWWNETYPVVPGLANIEDRLGFNSNFFLLSAIFSLRFIIGEPVYDLQPFIFICFILWGFFKLFRSRGEIEAVILFLGLTIFSVLNLFALFTTSTDILPNLLFIYLTLSVLLDNGVVSKNSLLFILTPLLIITIKISLAPIVLLVFLALYLLYKGGHSFAKISLLSVVVGVIPLLWLIRNVIISGYLVYPMSAIDLFSFDWKIPKEIAMIQKQYIYDYPMSVWKERLTTPFVRDTSPVWYNILILSIPPLFVLLLPFALCYIYKKMKLMFNLPLLLVFIISLVTIVIGIGNGFDFRFIGGAVLFFLVLGGIAFFKTVKISTIGRWKYIAVLFFFLTYGLWTSAYFDSKTTEVKKISEAEKGEVRSWKTILLSQYPGYEFMSTMDKVYINMQETELKDRFGTFMLDDKFKFYMPYTPYALNKYPYIHEVAKAHHGKLTDYTCIRARGELITDGFRMDRKCMEDNLYKVKAAMKEAGY